MTTAKKMTIITLLMFPFLINGVSCSNNGGESVKYIDTKVENFDFLNESHVRYLGRHLKKEENNKESMLFGFTCTGFELFVDVKDSENEIKVKLLSDLTGGNTTQYVACLVDNKRTSKFELQLGEQELTIFKNLPIGKHTLKFLKLNEASVSKLELLDMQVSKSIDIYSREYKEKRKLIEFYGDSITTGYGNLGSPESKTFKTSEQDGMRTYGYIASEKLDFDSSFVACSGISLTESLAPYGVNMMSQYDTIEGSIKYDMSKNQPDYVVINLGSNDHDRYNQADGATQKQGIEDFKRDYMFLMEEILKYSPNTKFVSCYDMCYTIATRISQAIKEVTNKINEKYGENTAIYKKFSNNQSGANGHPSEIAHEIAGDTLYKLIEEEFINK